MNFISSLNLASQTALQKQDLRKVRTILTFLMDNNDSAQFKTPVDWQGLQLMDYPQIITHPMDLGTVLTKMHAQQYRFVQAVLDDIQLIWDNCKSYNVSGSWIYGVADKMQKYFKKLIKNYFTHVAFSTKAPTHQISEPIVSLKPTRTSRRNQKNQNKLQMELEDQELSSNDKNKIIDNIKNLETDDLGTIIQFIMEKCPKAYHQIEEGKVSIVLSHFDSELYRQLKGKLAELRQMEDHLHKRVKM